MTATPTFTNTTLTGANALTLGTSNTNTGAIVFKGSGAGTGTLTLQGPTTPNAGNFTLTIPTITANDTICTVASGCGGATGATTALDNLASVAINTSLLPGTTNSISLGDGTHTWANGYFGTAVYTPVIRPLTDSTTAFQVQNASGGQTILNVDTSNKRVGINTTPTAYSLEVNGTTQLGSTSSTGVLVIRNASSQPILAVDSTNNKLNLQAAGNATSFNQIYNAQSLNFTGKYWNGSSSTSRTFTISQLLATSGIDSRLGFLNNAGTEVVTFNDDGTSNFTGQLTAPSLQAASLDTATAVPLNIGTTMATSITIGSIGATAVNLMAGTGNINLNSSTVLAAGKSITFTAGGGNFDQSASTGFFKTGIGAVSLNGDTTLASGKVLSVQGAASFQNATNSSTAFAVNDSTSGSALVVDTSHRWVGINSANPTATLDVAASSPSYFNNFESGLLSPFTTSGGATAQWSVTTSASPVPYSGSYVAQVYAPNSTNNVANLILTKTLTSAGNISFYYQCTSYWDGFTFQIDGGVKNAMPGCGGWGTSGWLYASYGVAGGTHTFTWSFNGVNTGGNPSMSVDDVNITNVGGGTAAIFNGGGVGIGLGAGNSPAHTLDVQGDAQFKSLTDSTTALQIQNAGGGSLLNIGTLNNQIDIGTSSTPLINDNMTTNAPTGSLIGSASWVPGSYVQLNAGSYSGGEVEYTPALVSQNFDASFEFNTTGGADATYLYAFDTSTPSADSDALGGYHVAFNEFSGIIRLFYNGTLLASYSVATINNSTWHGVEVVKSGTNIKVYYDSALVINYTDSARTLTGVKLGLGGWSGGGSSTHRVRNFTVSTGSGVLVGNVNLKLYGTQLIQPATDSATAFQVQNAAGRSVLNVDTQNTALVLGSGDGTGTVGSITVRGAAAAGTDIQGANIKFDASNGTGSAGSGAFIFRTASGTSGATITHDASSSAEVGNGNTGISWSHTTANQTNRILIVGISTVKTSSPASTVTAVTYNGVSLAKLAGQAGPTSSGYTNIEIWYLVAPPIGTYTVAVSVSAGSGIAGGATTFYNTTQYAPTLYNSKLGSGSNPSIVLNGTTTNNMVMVALANETDNAAVGSGMTSRWARNASVAGLFGATKLGGTGSTSLSWTSTANNWSQIVFAISPVGGSASDALTEALRVNSNGNIGLQGSTGTPYNLTFGAISGVTTARTIGVDSQVSVDTGGNGLTISSGTGEGTGVGGTTTISGGAGGASGIGGQLVLQGGNGSGTGSVGGDIILQGGANGTTSGTSGSVIVKSNGGNSATALQIQNAGSTPLLNVDSITGNITFGNATNGVIFAPSTGLTAYGTAQHTKSIVLTPEYIGAVLDASNDTGGTVNCSTNNNGTMTSGLDLTNRMNYYNWTSGQAGSQCYDVVVQIAIPSDWAAWSSTTPFSVKLNTDSTANGQYAMEIRNSSGTAETSTASWATIGSLGSAATWTAVSPSTLASTTTGYTAGDYLTLRIRLSAKSNANIKLGNITLNYKSNY